jgi:amidophosphoribosyltransferase
MELLKHECGVAMIRLRKPLPHYYQKYGTWQYGINKLYLLMEKQHNRGQEGAGIGFINTTATPGDEYILRERAIGSDAIKELFEKIASLSRNIPTDFFRDPVWVSENLSIAGNSLIGHLRYSTTGKNGAMYLHPFLRRSNWRSRNLLLCGNFNLTNVQEMFEYMVAEGQHPRLNADTYLMLETLGNNLDRHIQQLYDRLSGNAVGETLNSLIAEETDLAGILKSSSMKWDGGYVVCGFTGDGAGFAMRDPWGIRTAFYYADEEALVVASERPVIQTAFNLDVEDISELSPGEALIISGKNEVRTVQIRPPAEKITPCSFERIYFSRGSDRDIYTERKTLGRRLVPKILDSIDGDLENTVFSFIPNTAEMAFFGMMEGFEEHLREKQKILVAGASSHFEIDRILSMRVRQEKVAIKDIKLRTFISEDAGRDDLAAHVYDITYGSIIKGRDKLVIIDDSIVRGTTLKQSIIKILDRLGPTKIVIVSSSPQVRYPDCYGIDMSSIQELAAFRAAIALLQESGRGKLIDEVYAKCLQQAACPKEQISNFVAEIYEPFTADEISRKIAELLTPEEVKAEINIVYQSIEGLRAACPNHRGDWYFTGVYPTPGGKMFVNNAFIDYYQGKKRGIEYPAIADLY